MKTKPRVSFHKLLVAKLHATRREPNDFRFKKTAGLPRSNPQPGIGFAPRHEDRIGIGIQSVGRHAR